MSYETTPNRKTHVWLDPADSVLVEPIIAQERTAFDMLRGAGSSSQNAWLSPETGWQIEPLQRRASSLSELSALTGSILGPGQLTVASGFVLAPAFCQESDMPGVTYGAGVQTGGDLFYQKQVQAGQTWDDPAFRLTGDQASYPAPTAGAEDVPMDRVAVGTTAYGADGDYFLRFTVPGGRMRAPDHVLTFYFPGPPLTGYGQWAIVFGGDGYADVFELGPSGWAEVQRMVYCPAHQVGRAPHLIHVAPREATNNPKLSGVILFEFTLAREPARASSANGHFVPSFAESKQAVISIPLNNLSVNPIPLRMDIRRDLRIQFQVSLGQYPASASLTDDAFSASFYPSASEPLLLAWSADVPSGCAVVGELRDAETGSVLSSAGSLGGFPLYTPSYPSRTYFVKFSLTGGGNATPTLMSYRVQRDAVIVAQRTTPSELTESTRSVAITGADDDPSHETATIRLATSPAFALGGEHVVTIETEYDPADSTKRAVLHRGTAVRTETRYRLNGRSDVRLTSAGMWLRLAEALSPIRFNFGLDYRVSGPPTPYKVTDALTTLFALAGYGASDLDIPDLPIRLFPSGDADGLLLEPQVALGDLIVRYARDYLGYLAIADPNVGASGMWRLKPINSGTPILAAFQSAGPSVAGPPQNIGAYPATPPTAFIRRDSHRAWVKPPLGNVVIAFGAAMAAAGNGVPQLYKQILVNPVSFDFAGSETADPTSPDYLGRMRPIYQHLPAQASADAVSWVARRVFDASCHGRQLHSFQAPLLLVDDETDDLLTHSRPLRVNDAVTIDETICRLRNVNPGYGKDAHQFAFYEAEEVA